MSYKYMLNNVLKAKKPKSLGFSLVELMIAILIGVFILTGLVTVFDTSSRMSRTQNGLARIQENGRFILSLMKDQISQAGYSSCFAETEVSPNATAPTKLAWNIQATNFDPSLPVEVTLAGNAFDPAHLIQGHECTAGSCNPSLTVLGADASLSTLTVGTGLGQMVRGTDILTIRYLRGAGREVANLDVPPGSNNIAFTSWATANGNPINNAVAGGQVLLMGCGAQSPWVGNVVTSGSSGITTQQALPDWQPLMKAYNMQRDFINVSYYVANTIVDGRTIPTMYSLVNGVANPLIEGVDAFDLIYGVKDANNSTRFITADEVQNMTAAECWPASELAVTVGSGIPLVDTTGCGWRSVVSVEVHLLLNSVFNSSNFDSAGNQPFKYSQLGTGDLNQTNLPSTIPHYNMHRKEFYMSVALKNILH